MRSFNNNFTMIASDTADVTGKNGFNENQIINYFLFGKNKYKNIIQCYTLWWKRIVLWMITLRSHLF